MKQYFQDSTSDMELSIIIVNYNTKKLSLDCINSIYKSNPKTPFEIILVDNASSDGSADAIYKKFGNKKNFQVISSSENLGFAKGNNLGINAASGKFILLLNSDTKVIDNAIDRMIEFAKSEDNIGAVGGQLLNSDFSIQPSAYKFPSLFSAIKQYWLGENGLMDKYTPSKSDPIDVDVLVMAAFLITPLGLKKVGLLDEKYFMYFEDFDYCRSLSKAGLRIVYLPAAKIIHYHGASGKNGKSDSQWKKLIPSSKLYHGTINHHLITFVLWSGQKLNKIIG